MSRDIFFHKIELIVIRIIIIQDAHQDFLSSLDCDVNGYLHSGDEFNPLVRVLSDSNNRLIEVFLRHSYE